MSRKRTRFTTYAFELKTHKKSNKRSLDGCVQLGIGTGWNRFDIVFTIAGRFLLFLHFEIEFGFAQNLSAVRNRVNTQSSTAMCERRERDWSVEPVASLACAISGFIDDIH